MQRAGSGTETAVVDALVDGSLAPSSLTDVEVLAALDEVAARRRALEATAVALVGEAASRVEHVPVDESLIRAGGHRSLVEAVEHRLSVRRAEARTICEVADATRQRVTCTGAPLPVRFPHVAAALGAALISVAQAEQIVAGLSSTGDRVAVEDLERAEVELVAAATGTSPEHEVPATPALLRGYAIEWVAFLDPDGARPSEERQRELRSLTFSRRRDGMVRMDGLCTPEQHETLQTALDAHVTPRKLRIDCADDGSSDDGSSDDGDRDGDSSAAACDTRSIEQRRIDAFVAIVTAHAKSADAPRVGGAAPTLVVATTLADLEGRAEQPADTAHLQRSGDPASPETIARLVCDGLIQPVLVDADHEPLRLGRTKRLFTPAQRRAITVRDRHCRAPGCLAPPGWCEVHHITPWSLDGPTNVDNGILLCSFHHHEVHRGALIIERVAARDGAATDASGRWRVRATRPPRPRSPRRRRSPAVRRLPRILRT